MEGGWARVLILITAPNQISSGPDQALWKGGRVGAEHSISDFLEIKAFERSESFKIVPQVAESAVRGPSFLGQCLCRGWLVCLVALLDMFVCFHLVLHGV